MILAVAPPPRWLLWFIACFDRALDRAEAILGNVMRKARFWKSVDGQPFNERQPKVINRLLDGFEGKLTNGKWAALTKVSPDTALRDINDLVERSILVRNPAGGRSTSYSLVPGTGLDDFFAAPDIDLPSPDQPTLDCG